jgi:hypothetical protein
MTHLLKKIDIVSYLFNKLNLKNIEVIFDILDFEKNWQFSDIVINQIKNDLKLDKR